jgi:hypothetical protein
MLEETRRALNKRDDTLAIGVTFNVNTTYSVGENGISETDTLPLHLDAVLSVALWRFCTRNPSMTSSMPLAKALTIWNTDRNLAKFFRSFLDAVIETLAARDHGGKLKNLVLLMDEVMRPLDATRRSLQLDEIAEKNLVSSQFADFLSALIQEKALSVRSIILLPTGVLSAQQSIV